MKPGLVIAFLFCANFIFGNSNDSLDAGKYKIYWGAMFIAAPDTMIYGKEHKVMLVIKTDSASIRLAQKWDSFQNSFTLKEFFRQIGEPENFLNEKNQIIVRLVAFQSEAVISLRESEINSFEIKPDSACNKKIINTSICHKWKWTVVPVCNDKNRLLFDVALKTFMVGLRDDGKPYLDSSDNIYNTWKGIYVKAGASQTLWVFIRDYLIWIIAGLIAMVGLTWFIRNRKKK